MRNDEKLLDSKLRKEAIGRKSDGGFKPRYKNLEQQLLHFEIKNPKVINKDGTYHPDFVKSCNLLINGIDSLLLKDCSYKMPGGFFFGI